MQAPRSSPVASQPRRLIARRDEPPLPRWALAQRSRSPRRRHRPAGGPTSSSSSGTTSARH